jgi:His-Xaa-Ser system radical SAM maturase HxsC
VPRGYGLYLTRSDVKVPADLETVIGLPRELDYLGHGDVVALSQHGRDVSVMWRSNSRQNSVLLTERCDNACLMCSQPPKTRDDGWLIDRAMDIIELLPADAREVIFTGGEPTLYGRRLLDLLARCKSARPGMEIHLLTNGRRFADSQFAGAYAAIDHPRLMAGIPLYGCEASLHDHVVQAPGAFDDTVRGLLNLAAVGARVEIRVVIHAQTAPALVDIARFIVRNLPFVDQVALMGLEVTGYARSNLEALWIDPFDYKEILTEATLLLHHGGVRTLVFNHQLCVIEPRLWKFAVRSISDWKNEYAPACAECSERARCGGFFHSMQHRFSDHIEPILAPPISA